MRLRIVLAAIALFSASLASRADTLYTFGDTSFTLPTSGTPATYDANSFYYNNVTVTKGSATTSEQVFFGLYSGEYSFGVAHAVTGNSSGLTLYPAGQPYAAVFSSVALFSGTTASPTLLNGTFPLVLSSGGSTVTNLVVSTAPAPEPSSLALLGTGIVGVTGLVRKRLAR